MSSVSSNIDCPRCNSAECWDEFNCNTGETHINCPDCGYLHINRYKREDNGKLSKLDQSKGCEFKNLIPETIHVPEPFGSLRVNFKNGMSMNTCVDTEEDYRNHLQHIKNMSNEDVEDVKGVIISRFIDGKIKKEVVIL